MLVVVLMTICVEGAVLGGILGGGAVLQHPVEMDAGGQSPWHRWRQYAWMSG